MNQMIYQWNQTVKHGKNSVENQRKCSKVLCDESKKYARLFKEKKHQKLIILREATILIVHNRNFHIGSYKHTQKNILR